MYAYCVEWIVDTDGGQRWTGVGQDLATIESARGLSSFSAGFLNFGYILGDRPLGVSEDCLYFQLTKQLSHDENTWIVPTLYRFCSNLFPHAITVCNGARKGCRRAIDEF